MKLIYVLILLILTGVVYITWVPTSQESEWIVGYGSLINISSRLNTLQQGNGNKTKLPEWYSINIKGYRRSWTAQSNTTTYLGVDDTNNDNDIINAVAFRLDNPNSLIHFDNREHLYNRVLVPLNRLESQTVSGCEIETGLRVHPEGAIGTISKHSINDVQAGRLTTTGEGRSPR